MYNDQIEDAMEVLIRASYTILRHEIKELLPEQVDDLFIPKYGVEEGIPIIELVKSSHVHCFHLAKIAGDREMREMYRQSDL